MLKLFALVLLVAGLACEVHAFELVQHDQAFKGTGFWLLGLGLLAFIMTLDIRFDDKPKRRKRVYPDGKETWVVDNGPCGL